jgi:hypothetical protein
MKPRLYGTFGSLLLALWGLRLAGDTFDVQVGSLLFVFVGCYVLTVLSFQLAPSFLFFLIAVLMWFVAVVTQYYFAALCSFVF